MPSFKYMFLLGSHISDTDQRYASFWVAVFSFCRLNSSFSYPAIIKMNKKIGLMFDGFATSDEEENNLDLTNDTYQCYGRLHPSDDLV